jgi:xanthine dehydrogenase large subunit
MFVIEAAIAKAAESLGINALEIQKVNLLKTGDEFLYGQKAVSEAHECWQKAATNFELEKLLKETEAFNQQNTLYKKGIALMPICFGISFTKTLMNNARALVHIYSDGSVGISTGAVEMGQGVNTKIMQVAAHVFSLGTNHIRINSTNTFRIANTSPSAASATADLNGRATQMACEALLLRLKNVAAEELKVDVSSIKIKEEKVFVNDVDAHLSWKQLVTAAFLKRVNLSEHAHYATPEIHFDASKEKGHPFAYHVFGTSIFSVTIDSLRGTYTFDSVQVVHDIGKSMNEIVDRGQCEGGIVQGIGWMTMEEIIYDAKGKLKSNALSTYKVPDIYSAPKILDVQFHESSRENLAILNSKAVGEPPIMYGIGAYFALRNAVKAFNPKATIPFDTPMTPEKTLMALYSNK